MRLCWVRSCGFISRKESVNAELKNVLLCAAFLSPVFGDLFLCWAVRLFAGWRTFRSIRRSARHCLKGCLFWGGWRSGILTIDFFFPGGPPSNSCGLLNASLRRASCSEQVRTVILTSADRVVHVSRPIARRVESAGFWQEFRWRNPEINKCAFQDLCKSSSRRLRTT